LTGGKTRLLRLRLVGYAAMLLVMTAAFVWAWQARPLLSLDITKDRGLFRENTAGQIENIYRLKIINKTQQPHRYAVSLVEPGPFGLQGAREVHLAAGEIYDLPGSVALTTERAASHTLPVYFQVMDVDQPAHQISAKSTFVAPVHR